MALDISCFQTLAPSRYVTFTIPNPCRRNSAHRLLRIAVLDSPLHRDGQPRVAAILVPENRERDWIFCTESGHLQLLLSNTPDFSRLILVGCESSDGRHGLLALHLHRSAEAQNALEEAIGPLLLALLPKICFDNGIPEVPILRYEDDLISSAMIEKCTGDYVGEMLIEDVELESEGPKSEEREFRRRLRFRRMPNLVQTQVRIVPESDVGTDIGKAMFKIDSWVLVHPYLAPMVASLNLVSTHIEDQFRVGLRLKVLCLGVGGGALVSFLKGQLGFKVVGVEIDDEVLRVARQYFGLEEDGEMISIIRGDAIEVVKKLSCQRMKGNSVASDCNDLNDLDGIETQFDVIMVDIDSGDTRNGSMAPPLEFMERSVLSALRSILCESGIVAVNVIPSNRSFYESLLCAFREVFCDLYEIDVGNKENFVLIATVTSIADCSGNYGSSLLMKLKSVISGAYIDSIKKV
ncbi:eEF1A lysine and N-terminal methyltransferase [Punica granatum]|uniref:Uncharacterized protein n=2 Tax=Punica granatum TaxID=22663 RepID=A0A2I0KL65_PUNGR|nr:eEF1A lysine and N-terminal methyltransferase [Punica granatum]PKI68556.1 hypothetical protein CRG98_011042 [Punica granatum]